jgi:hypothetical protein
MNGFGIVQINGVEIDAGRLPVSLPEPVVPPGGTPVKRVYYSDVSTIDDQFYLIGDGLTLYLSCFCAGAQGVLGGNVVSLWIDENGDGLNLELVPPPLFVDGASNYRSLTDEIPGNGIRRILLRRERLGGGSALIHGQWEGYVL